MTSVLIHSCCGPCSTYVVNELQSHDFDVTLFWYNPNVHPFREHELRRDAVREFSRARNLPLIVEDSYDMIAYFRAVVGHESERCPHCYRLRLSKTAEAASRGGFDAFTTTLLISPYQQHDLLREMGDELGKEWGITFHYEDFRPGFRESHRLSRELGLYHQGYCGCVYSEWERYGKVKV